MYTHRRTKRLSVVATCKHLNTYAFSNRCAAFTILAALDCRPSICGPCPVGVLSSDLDGSLDSATRARLQVRPSPGWPPCGSGLGRSPASAGPRLPPLVAGPG